MQKNVIVDIELRIFFPGWVVEVQWKRIQALAITRHQMQPRIDATLYGVDIDFSVATGK